MKTTSKKLIGFIAAAAMTVSLLPANIAFAENYETWTAAANAAQSETDYTYDSASNTYTVNTAKGLAFVAKVVNDGDTDINITLADNIDLLDAGVTEYGKDTVTATNSWIPIGNSSNKYIGTFDGAGYRISNLYVYSSDLNYSGLFGYIDQIGQVESIIVASGEIKISSKNNIASYAGGIAGDNYGTIMHCKNYCEIINDSESNAYAGGIAGDNHGRIESSYNDGAITGNSVAGGIAGTNWGGTIENCNNMGYIQSSEVGGISGINNEGLINKCINTGEILCENSSLFNYAGGIAGDCEGSTYKDGVIEAKVINSINKGKICIDSGGEGYVFVGGIAGNVNNESRVMNCANDGIISGRYVGGIVGWNDCENIFNCVSNNKLSGNYLGGCIGYGSISINLCYYLYSEGLNIGGAVISGSAENSGTFSLGSDGKYVIDGGGDLVEKLNEYVTDNKEYDLTSWSGENGGLKLGNYVVIEPTEPEPTPGEVTTSAIAVAEGQEAEITLKNNGISTAEGIYGGNEYGNTISTTFKTTQAISDASMSYGVWTVDLTADGSYVKSTAGKEGAIVTDGENVKNNKGAIYAMDSKNAGEYKLYFNKTTHLSGEGEVVFGLVIDGLYAPSATAEFEFKDTAPEGATEMTNDNSIFKGAGEDYVHDDSVLHPAQ